MVKNLRKGMKVCFKISHGHTRKGTVTKKYTAPVGSVNTPKNKRTIVHVKSDGQLFVKYPNELRRCK